VTANPFLPLSDVYYYTVYHYYYTVETYGRLGQRAMKLVHLLAGHAWRYHPGLMCAWCSERAERWAGVGAIFWAARASVGMLDRSSGTSVRAGLSMPTDECME
jgi:hypothetical protein